MAFKNGKFKTTTNCLNSLIDFNRDIYIDIKPRRKLIKVIVKQRKNKELSNLDKFTLTIATFIPPIQMKIYTTYIHRYDYIAIAYACLLKDL